MYFKYIDFDDSTDASLAAVDSGAIEKSQRKWQAMRHYLDKPHPQPAAIVPASNDGGTDLDESDNAEISGPLAWAIAASPVLAILIPVITFFFAEDTFPFAIACAVSIAILAIPVFLLLRKEAKPKALPAAQEPTEPILPTRDDGDNDLEELKTLASCLDGFEDEIERSPEQLGKKAEATREFVKNAKAYVLLSFWDGGEKRIERGFAETVMRTAAAWDAYVAIAESEEYAAGYAKVADAQIDEVLEAANKAAYRNFARVDAKIHGQDHIFDLPDAPRSLTDAEKLSIAAAIARDAE